MKQSLSVVFICLLFGATLADAQIKFLNKIIVPFVGKDAICKAVTKRGNYFYACGSLKSENASSSSSIFVIRTTGNPDSIQKFEWTPPDSGAIRCSADFIDIDSFGGIYVGINYWAPNPLYVDMFNQRSYLLKLSPTVDVLWGNNMIFDNFFTSCVVTQLRVTPSGNVLVLGKSLFFDTIFNETSTLITMDRNGENVSAGMGGMEYTDTSYIYYTDLVLHSDTIAWYSAVKKIHPKNKSLFLSSYYLSDFPLSRVSLIPVSLWRVGAIFAPVNFVPEKLALDESGFVFLSATDYDSTGYFGAIKKHSSTITHVDPMLFSSTYLDNFRLSSTFSKLKYITLRSQEGGSTIFSTGNRFDPTHNNTSNIITACFTSEGNKLWEKETNMSPVGLSEYPNGITLGHNYTTTVTGNYTDPRSPLNETNGFVISYDRYGNTIDSILLGDQGISLFAQTNDGNNTIAAGSILQQPSGNRAAYILSFDPMPLAVSKSKTSTQNLSVYPNPASNETKISFATHSHGKNVQINLIDNIGRNLAQIPCPNSNDDEQSIQLSTNDIPNGLYWITLRSDLGFQIAPIVIRK